jgi:hypothetical protein
MGYRTLEQMNQVLTWYPKTQWEVFVQHRLDADNEYVPFVLVGLVDTHSSQSVYINDEGYFASCVEHSYECSSSGYETSIDDLVEEIYVNIVKRRNERVK